MLNLSGVSVEILNTIIPNLSNTNLSGDYISGTADPNSYDIVFSKAGYLTDTITANLVAGVVTVVDAQLVPLSSFTANGMVIDINGIGIPDAEILIYNNDFKKALKSIRARAILMPCNQDLYFRTEDNMFEKKFIKKVSLRPIDSANSLISIELAPQHTPK